MTNHALPRVQTCLGGVLGQAVDASRRGRLSTFIVDGDSPALRIFAAAHRDHNVEGDWYGEHAGKWLVAAARAAARSGDAALTQRVQQVAHFLVDQQQPDGYLGTYAPSQRFMQPQPPKPGTWDGAPAQRTWDIWTHSYLILGLLEVHRHFPSPPLLQAARRIGDLCWQTLTEGGIGITALGNHHGLSATVLMDPAAQLYLDTGEPRYLQLALLVLEQADADPALGLLRKALAGVDAADIATGKAYQLQWNLVGLAKLHRATGRADLLQAVQSLWASIRSHHLTLGGGPWGGVGQRSREVFNPPGQFSPLAYVETCSTLSWMQLNAELLAITGDAVYAEEVERSAYNDLLGAAAANGEDWCYYVFPNGRRVHTTTWRCCKSSGAMALEELPGLACSASVDAGVPVLQLNLHAPGVSHAQWPGGLKLTLTQHGAYPFEDKLRWTLEFNGAQGMGPAATARVCLRLRIPAWAEGAHVLVNEQPVEQLEPPTPGQFLDLDRHWSHGDRIALSLPMAPRLERRSSINVQESRAPDGSAVRQEVMHFDHAAVMRGPLVYATGLIDGHKVQDTIRLPAGDAQGWLHTLPTSSAALARQGPTVRLTLDQHAALHFEPYYRAGGREHGAWRLTWLALAPSGEPPFTDEAAP